MGSPLYMFLYVLVIGSSLFLPYRSGFIGYCGGVHHRPPGYGTSRYKAGQTRKIKNNTSQRTYKNIYNHKLCYGFISSVTAISLLLCSFGPQLTFMRKARLSLVPLRRHMQAFSSWTPSVILSRHKELKTQACRD